MTYVHHCSILNSGSTQTINIIMQSFQVAVVLGLASFCWAQGGGYYGGGFGGAGGLGGGYGGAEGYAVGGHGHGDEHIDYYAPPKYGYEYKVNDPHTGDFKSQHETREGDVVKGYYTLKEADGTIREVHYTADHKNGFNAEVKRTGHAVHPQHYKSGPEHY